MNKLVKTLGLSTILLATVAADGPGMRVFGGSRAAMCYKAVSGQLTADAYLVCTKALEEGVTSTSDQVATLNNRGVVQMARNPSGALADFDKAISVSPKYGEPYLNKALVLMQSEGRWRDALPLFDKALANKTSRPELAYYGRGFAQELSGNAKAAYADYRRAAAIDPKWDVPKQQLARFAIAR